eukprot:6210067-Pleurochrysis_carterae.AAC.2
MLRGSCLTALRLTAQAPVVGSSGPRALSTCKRAPICASATRCAITLNLHHAAARQTVRARSCRGRTLRRRAPATALCNCVSNGGTLS